MYDTHFLYVQIYPRGFRPWAASKAKFWSQDMLRNKKWFNVPNMKPTPSNFFGPTGPADKSGLARDFRYQRCLTAVREHYPKVLPEATANMFNMIWTDERDADGNVQITEARLCTVLERSGLSHPEASTLVSEHLASDANKARLKDMCAEALAEGVFGAPTFCVDGQIWFGSDRLEQMCHHLALPYSGPDPNRPTVDGSSKL